MILMGAPVDAPSVSYVGAPRGTIVGSDTGLVGKIKVVGQDGSFVVSNPEATHHLIGAGEQGVGSMLSMPSAPAGGSGKSTATVVVAASNSSASSKAGADFVCSGTNDHVTINAAIDSLPSSGGKVVFMEGFYNSPGEIIVDDHCVSLEGQGPGYNTVIGVPSGTVNRRAAIIAGNTKRVEYFSISSIAINSSGGTQAVKSGTGHGIVVTGDGYVIKDVLVQFCSGDPFHYGQDLITPSVNTSVASPSNGYALGSASYPATDTVNVISTTGFPTTGEVLVRKSSGQIAYITYTGKTSTSFTGCKSNWLGDVSYTLATGDFVFQCFQTYNGTTTNTLANHYGGEGYYIDWNFSSCEWVLARANGNNSGRPTSKGSQNGFNVQGTLLKFNMCHPYFNTGIGMKIGDTHSYTAGEIHVLGGEYESNMVAGIKVRINNAPVRINDAFFYGNGLDSTAADVWMDYYSHDVYVQGCTFNQGLGLVGKQVFAIGAKNCVIEDNSFQYDSSVQNVFVYGGDVTYGPNSFITVRNNRFTDNNSGSVAVLLTGATTDCLIDGNTTDAKFSEEVASSTSPDRNLFVGNTLIPGQGAAFTLTGPASRVFGKGRLWLSVKDYGALGDDTGDDSAAFNNLLQTLSNAGGGVVYVPTGVYRLTSSIGLGSTAVSNVEIQADPGAVIKAAADITPITGSWYRSTISGLLIDANLQGSPCMNIHMVESVVRKCRLYGWIGYGVRLNDGTYGDLGLLNHFEYNLIDSGTGVGIYQTYRWIDSWITNNNIGSTDSNLSLEGGPLRITGNHLDGSPRVNITLRGNKRVQITNNILEGSGESSIEYTMPSWLTADSPQIHIGDNAFSNGGKSSAGTYPCIKITGVSSSYKTDGFSIVGNIFSCEDSGSGWNYIVSATNANHVTAVGNQWSSGYTVSPVYTSSATVTTAGNTS